MAPAGSVIVRRETNVRVATFQISACMPKASATKSLPGENAMSAIVLAEPTLIEVPVGAVDVTGMFQNRTIPSLVPTASSSPLGEMLMPQPCALARRRQHRGALEGGPFQLKTAALPP